MGKKKRPAYRFVVSDSAKDTYGRALEIVGHYNPFSKVVEVKKDRIMYWISKGAQTSPTVHNILVDQNVITAKKVKASKAGKKAVEEKTEVKTEVKVEEVKSQSTAEKPAQQPKAEEKPVEEKKAEEPKVEEVKVKEPKPSEEKTEEAK